jgi:hypothetical protein
MFIKHGNTKIVADFCIFHIKPIGFYGNIQTKGVLYCIYRAIQEDHTKPIVMKRT